MKKTKLVLSAAIAAAFLMALPNTPVHAAKGDQGVDWSIYQGNYGKYGYAKDKFVISQIGGVTPAGIYNQSTYNTQVRSAIAAGKRAHTYVWFQVGGSRTLAGTAMKYFLQHVQTPKGSIIALDYEAGASSSKFYNTDAIEYGLTMIKSAGYTPMLYGYKSYLTAHTNLSQIAAHYQLWLAEYPDYNVTTKPNYNYFPSYNNVGIFQFTSTYRAGGLDGNVDLTGITDNGYSKAKRTSTGKVVVKPKTSTPATKAGQAANSTPKSVIAKGTRVKVNLSARHWATGQAIPSFVLGQTYTVQQVSGNRVLLGGIMSWINKGNVEILQTAKQSHAASTTDYAQRGTFRPYYTMRIRTAASTSARITGTLSGYTITYNHIYIRGGYVWARYQAYSGTRYVAIGVNGGQSYGSRHSY